MGNSSWVVRHARRRVVIAAAAFTLLAAAAAFPPHAKANVIGPTGCDTILDGNPCHFVATAKAPGTAAANPVEGYISYTTGDFVIHDETDPTQTDFKGSGPGAAHIPFELFAGHKFSVTVSGGEGGIQAGAYTSEPG